MAMKRALLLSVLAGLLVLDLFTWAEAQFPAQRVQRQSITTAGADCTIATSCVVLPDVFRTSNGLFDLSGTWTGTLAFEGSIDCSTWRPIAATPLSGTPNAVTTATAGGAWSFSAPLCGVRVRASTLSSGTAIVSINAVSSGGGGFGGGAASNVTVVNGSTTLTDGLTHPGGDTSVAETESNTFNWAGTLGWEAVRNCPTVLAINQTASTQLLAGVSAKKVYVCDLDIVTDTAQKVSLVEGTGSVCGTGTAALIGGTTADATHGMSFAANSGIAKNYQGRMRQATAADALCLLQSSTGLISGTLTYIQE